MEGKQAGNREDERRRSLRKKGENWRRSRRKEEKSGKERGGGGGCVGVVEEFFAAVGDGQVCVGRGHEVSGLEVDWGGWGSRLTTGPSLRRLRQVVWCGLAWV